MIVRPARLVDLTTLRLLWESLWREQSWSYPALLPDDMTNWTADMAVRLERQMGGDGTICTFLAEDDHARPLGFLSAQLVERRVGSPHRYLLGDHLYVIPAARGAWHGVGPALLLAALDYAIPLGVDVVELVAMAGDTQWARHGWQPIMTRYATTVAQMRARLQRSSKHASQKEAS